MSSYEFELIGRTPLLMHLDDVMAADKVEEWRLAPENRSQKKPGDDRVPAWAWTTYLYVDPDADRLVIPSENLMACLRKAGAEVNLGRFKNAKALSQSSIIMIDTSLGFLSRGKNIPWKPIAAMATRPFKEQYEEVQKMGFRLLVKRANVAGKKHVRVRAMFDSWVVRGSLEVTDSKMDERIHELFQIAGRYVGLCDWRPGSPKSPGTYGIYEANLKKVA